MAENNNPVITLTKIRNGGTYLVNPDAVNENFRRVLFTDNTGEYAPSDDYNPATKKYVDDKLTETNTSNINDLINVLERYSQPKEIKITHNVSEVNLVTTDENPDIVLGDAASKSVAQTIPAEPTAEDNDRLVTMGAAVNYVNTAIENVEGGTSAISVLNFVEEDWTENQGIYTLTIPAQTGKIIVIDKVVNSDLAEIMVDISLTAENGAVITSEAAISGKVYYHSTVTGTSQAQTNEEDPEEEPSQETDAG